MSKHTPGPWGLGRFSDGRPCGCLVGPDGKRLQFDTCGMGVHVPSRFEGCNEEERIANANLIAAAPDLLEALQVAEAELENHVGVPGVAEHVLPAIRAAIAKAEGRSE